MLQGYTMTGRTGLFPSYESFLGIIHTMMVQYSKFNKMSRESSWRKDLSSLNYLETSTWTRQEHNGLSHQNPCFIGAVLNLKSSAARVYLPPDPNTFLSTFAHCLRSSNYVNLIISSKHPQPVWLNSQDADAHCKAGGSIWGFASIDSGLDPDVVLVGIGSDLMFEVLAAAVYLRRLSPQLRVRVVNVTDLMILETEGSHPHALNNTDFDDMFTRDRHIHFNYHGYANELQGLLFGRPRLDRVTIESYMEEGSTTTPFDMVIRNRTSRYHVAEAAIRGGAERNEVVRMKKQKLLSQIQHDLAKTQQFIKCHGQGTWCPRCAVQALGGSSSATQLTSPQIQKEPTIRQSSLMLSSMVPMVPMEHTSDVKHAGILHDLMSGDGLGVHGIEGGSLAR
jgi:xylulose-5-phosphate/fructose-6-phosphate phosphoketolase